MYADGTRWTGTVYSDVVTIGGTRIENAQFVSIDKGLGNYFSSAQNAHGIMGMAYASLGEGNPTTMANLKENDLSTSFVLALCHVDSEKPHVDHNDNTRVGKLVLSQDALDVMHSISETSSVHSVQIIPGADGLYEYYNVMLVGVGVSPNITTDGLVSSTKPQNAKINSVNKDPSITTIFDSGWGGTGGLTSKPYNTLKKILTSAGYGDLFSDSFCMSIDTISDLPYVTYVFAGVGGHVFMHIPPELYTTTEGCDGDYKLNIGLNSDDSGNVVGNLLQTYFLQGYSLKTPKGEINNAVDTIQLVDSIHLQGNDRADFACNCLHGIYDADKDRCTSCYKGFGGEHCDQMV